MKQYPLLLLMLALAWFMSSSDGHSQSPFQVSADISSRVLLVGQPVTITVTTEGDFNPNCPGYVPLTMWLLPETNPNQLQDEMNPILIPARPDAKILPQENRVEWTLQANRPGTIIVRVDWSGELTGPDCGPPYQWGGGSKRFGNITVFDPNMLYQVRLPFITR